jgi:hypothetical protein
VAVTEYIAGLQCRGSLSAGFVYCDRYSRLGAVRQLCSLRTAAAQHVQFAYFLRLSPGDIICVCDKIASRSLGTNPISGEAQQKEKSDNSATCTATATLVLTSGNASQSVRPSVLQVRFLNSLIQRVTPR